MTQQEVDNIVSPGGLLHVKKDTDILWSQLGSAVKPYDWNMNYDVRKVLRASLSSAFFNLPVKDQGNSGSCGGQATSTHDSVLEAISTKSFEEESAKYVIAQTFKTDEQGNMIGSYMGDNVNIAVKQGISREVLCPSYDPQGKPLDDSQFNRPQDITEAARDDAKILKAKSYAFVNPNIEDFAQAIATNHGLVALLGGENNGTWFTEFPKPPSNRQWGHFMYWGAMEVINGRKGIWGIQSWGREVGREGWQWFGEDWFLSGFIQTGVTMVFDSQVALPEKYLFTRDLYIGKTGVDVRMLQRFLNTHGEPLDTDGPGSLGYETSYFGALTRDALIRFQKNHNIQPSKGYFGPLTRKVVNGMQ